MNRKTLFKYESKHNSTIHPLQSWMIVRTNSLKKASIAILEVSSLMSALFSRTETTWNYPFNDNAVEAAGDGANNGAPDDRADPGAGEPIFVAGSEHRPDAIGAAAPPPAIDAHIRVDPKILVRFKQIKHDKMCFEGYR